MAGEPVNIVTVDAETAHWARLALERMLEASPSMTSNHLIECDVLIIGCGIAGATAALRLAEDPNGCASSW